jgi:menaquinone-dependent protoporphyrinogen oxidase
LQARGAQVHVCDLADEQPDPSRFDVVVVGSPVRMARHEPAIEAWIRAHAADLASRPGAFFSVSLSAASPEPKVRGELAAMVERFLADTNWQPAHVARFAGALRHTRYPWWTRLFMRLMSGSRGAPADTRSDLEYTDWAQVDGFIDEIRSDLEGSRAVGLVG